MYSERIHTRLLGLTVNYQIPGILGDVWPLRLVWQLTKYIKKLPKYNIDKNKVSDYFFPLIFKVSGNKYCRQKVSGSINFKLFTISPTTYLIISALTVSKVSTIL